MQRKLFYTLMVLVLALSLTTPVLAQKDQQPLAQEELKSYIVILKQDPIIAYGGGIAGFAATEVQAGEKIAPEEPAVVAYDNFLENQHNESLEAAGASVSAKVHDYTVALNGYSALLTQEQAEAIKLQKNVQFVMEDQKRYPQTDSSPEFLGLTVRRGAYDSGITGEGVVVGVIDTGIWPEHPSFADDGSYAEPPTGVLPCEFGNTAWNPNDAPFTCNNKLIGARAMLDTYRELDGLTPEEFDSARDDDGHGTHTASTAAGNSDVKASLYGLPVATISGIAPRAHVIAYKACGQEGCWSSDTGAAIDQAVEDGVGVINFSIGGGAGGIGIDDLAFLFAADANVFAATSAGNSGPGVSTLGNPATMPWITAVGASTQKRFYEGVITLGNGKRYAGASLTPELGWTRLVDAAAVGNELCDPAVPFTGNVAGKVVLCLRGVVGRADKSLAVFNAGGAGMILYNANDVDNLFTDTHWVPSVHIDYTPGLKIKSYIAHSRFPKAKIETREDGWGCDRFDRHNSEQSNHNGDHHKPVCRPLTSKWPHAPTMTIFSSRGPNPVAADIIKPDVTAPGIQILAGNSPMPAANLYPGQLFQAIAGTSMSSPHVAGVFALLKQAHPEWSAAMAKSALMTTAYQDVRDNDRQSQADPFDMGAGHINPGGRWTKGSITEPGLVYDADIFDYLGFTCDPFPGFISEAFCASLEAGGVPTQAYNLNYPSIGVASVPFSRTIQRTVTSVASETVTYKAKVKAPPGFTVTVDPSTITLQSGESATFTVTFTNVSAPLDEWRFGSLTWRANKYSVYSPIAVKGSALEVPEEVSGSYDVTFGYTGPFSATARGLIPATTFTDLIMDDPNNNFVPGGPGTIGYEIVVPAGTTYARFSLFDADVSPASDLDLYVFDSAGNFVDLSGTASSNEEVNLLNPAADTYTVWVHGFGVAETGATYTLYTWVLGTADEGNMTVSAPASATSGTTATITLTFNGLVSGTKYLGSVAYSGVDGLPAPTIVRVDAP